MNAFRLALLSQEASNVSGLMHSMPDFAKVIRADVEAGRWPEFNTHPIVRLLAEQLMWLSGKTTWQEAWSYCLEREAKE